MLSKVRDRSYRVKTHSFLPRCCYIYRDDALLEKYRAGIITRKMLVDYAVDPVSIEKRLLY